MKQLAVLDVRITHSFYADGRCADLAVTPDDATALFLQKQRCQLRTSPDGVRVIMPFDDTGQPFVAVPAGAVLRFHLTLQDDGFPLFTDLSTLSAQAAPLFTTVGSTAGALALASSATPLPSGVLADVEIHLDGLSLTPAPAQPASFHADFQARRARWAYYCVTDLSATGGELHIVDASPAGTTDLVVFSDQNRTKLDQQPDPSDPIATLVAGRYPGMRCVRFLSDQPVAMSAAPRRYLELRRDTDRVVGPLPNPSVRDAARSDQLYRIIRYQTHPYQFQDP
jgi:hypothetical protein